MTDVQEVFRFLEIQRLGEIKKLRAFNQKPYLTFYKSRAALIADDVEVGTALIDLGIDVNIYITSSKYRSLRKGRIGTNNSKS